MNVLTNHVSSTSRYYEIFDVYVRNFYGLPNRLIGTRVYRLFLDSNLVVLDYALAPAASVPLDRRMKKKKKRLCAVFATCIRCPFPAGEILYVSIGRDRIVFKNMILFHRENSSSNVEYS